MAYIGIIPLLTKGSITTKTTLIFGITSHFSFNNENHKINMSCKWPSGVWTSPWNVPLQILGGVTNKNSGVILYEITWKNCERGTRVNPKWWEARHSQDTLKNQRGSPLWFWPPSSSMRDMWISNDFDGFCNSNSCNQGKYKQSRD